MTEQSLGQRIAEYRRRKNLTQADVAEAMRVSPQAVSKWENDFSCPDIFLLPELARLLDVSTDVLLSGEQAPEVRLVSSGTRKPAEQLILHVMADSAEGDRVRVNLPLPLVRASLELGLSMPQINGNDALRGIDLKKVLELVDMGLVGRLVEVQEAGGDTVVVEVS